MTLPEIALLRVAAQRLAGPRFESASEAVRWLTCVQAQDFPGALTSVALRTVARSRDDIIAALDAGEVVRSWPMRGTLHFTAAEDLPWIQRLLAPRITRSAIRRREGLGLDEPQVERARELATAALEGGRSLSRGDLFETWRRAGVDPGGQRGTHLLRHLAMTGTVVQGPISDGEQHVVLLTEWVPAPRVLEGDEALGELALRYFRSHGPALAGDLANWAKLTAAETRTAVSLARPALTTVEVEGSDYLLDPSTASLLESARSEAEAVLLLPGFDELVLGYRDRQAQLDPAYADRLVPGGNGMFRPSVVHAGCVVGTWARVGRGRQPRLDATPFTSFGPEVEAALPGVFAALPAL